MIDMRDYYPIDSEVGQYYEKHGRAKTIKWISKNKGYTIQNAVKKLNAILGLEA